jgi:hypothetical protein
MSALDILPKRLRERVPFSVPGEEAPTTPDRARACLVIPTVENVITNFESGGDGSAVLLL